MASKGSTPTSPSLACTLLALLILRGNPQFAQRPEPLAPRNPVSGPGLRRRQSHHEGKAILAPCTGRGTSEAYSTGSRRRRRPGTPR